MSPGLLEPTHLAPYGDVLDRAIERSRAGFESDRFEVHVLAAPPQHGKALADDTPILTKRGWITVGSVRVGDYFVGSDGGWTQVLAVYPQGEIQLYKVSFSNGKSARRKKMVNPYLEACGDHLWQVHNRYSGRPTIKNTKQLKGDLRESDKRNKWRLPIVVPLQNSHADLPINPYLLGCWLGDGTACNGSVTTMDEEIINSFRVTYDQGASNNKHTGRATTYNLLGLHHQLRLLGVKSNKHIPDLYLNSSVEQRLALLQGLCDTDGTVAKNGSQQSYCSTNPKLAEGFKYLVSSLGGIWTETIKPAADKIAWNIWFRLPHGLPAFRLLRKQDLLNEDSPRNQPRRFLESIKPSRVGRATCFTVDAPDKLFCAGRDLILTHNTFCTEHGVVKALVSLPGKVHAYVTYAQAVTRRVQAETRRICETIGLQGEYSQDSWWFPATKSGIIWTSVEGALTSHPVSGLLIVDDPLKDVAQARSQLERAKRWDWVKQVATKRLHPGATLVIMATRWVPLDPSGMAIKEWKAPFLNIQAICEDPSTDPLHRGLGEALWPIRRPLQFLLQQRQADPFGFRAQFQGDPQDLGTQLFKTPERFAKDLPPHSTFIAGWGIDLAYTKTTISDWSVMVYGKRVKTKDGDKLYITRVVRKQVDVTHFLDTMVLETKLKPAALRFYYGGGGESGVSSFISKKVRNFHAIQAKDDKVTRSQSAREAWNLGNIVVPDPDSPHWTQDLEDFIEEITQFTGTGDVHDDCIDALAALYDQLYKGQLDWSTVNRWQSQIGGFRL